MGFKRFTYDKSVDAAYIKLTGAEVGDAKKTYACDPGEVGGTINLDFDAEGRLLGIEVLDAKSKLPEDFLSQAEIIG